MIKKSNVKPYTKVSWLPDYEKFGISELSEDMFQLFNKTNTEAAAAASIYHFSKMTPRQAKKYLKNKGINVRT